MKILLRTLFFAAAFILRELKDCFIVCIEFDCCLESASGFTTYEIFNKGGLAVHQKVCQLPVRQFLFSNGTPYGKPALGSSFFTFFSSIINMFLFCFNIKAERKYT